jgi:flagellar biogenesis protein FliO
MLRLVLVILAILALLWMVVPMIQEDFTEIAFAAGSPDPNVYKTTYFFGWPLTWIAWERSWNQAAGYDESKVDSFNLLNLIVHLLLIAAPVVLYVRASRKASRKRSDGSED